MAKPKLYTEAEAAEFLGCSAATLWRRRKANQLRHYHKNGRLIRYTREDIDKNLDEMKACQPKPVVMRPVSEARFG